MEKSQKRVSFNLMLNQIYLVPAFDATRIPDRSMKRKNKRKNKTREKQLQGKMLENEKGKVLFVPNNGLFL